MSEEKNGIIPDASVDITTVVCPTTFVKAKVALDELDVGQVLSVRLNDGEAVANVPRSFRDEGQRILGLGRNGDGTWTLVVEKLVE